MKCIATIAVDLSQSPIGTRSRLADDLAGEPVLRRTIRRVLGAKRLDSVHVLAHADQAGSIKPLLEGLDVELETWTGPPPPYAAIIRAGRIWGLDGWRGGIGESCVFDEDIHVPLAAAIAERTSADAVASIPASAALIDSAMIDAMIAHFEASAGAFRMAIVQAPPGMGCAVFGRSLLEELAPSGRPPGLLLAYHPDRPGPDITGRQACYRPPAEVIEANGRLLCDTRRSMDRVRSLLQAGGEHWDAAEIARWLCQRDCAGVDRVPEEIEIELTTEDPLSRGSILRPRTPEADSRGPIALDTIRAVGEAIRDYDDVRVVLGGFGEPCCHPRFAEVCRILREAGAAAIAVRTNAALDDASIESAFFDTPLDVVEVTLDAASAGTYQRLHGADLFDQITARLERWLARRLSGQQVQPLIVPSLVKAGETLHEMEEFFDTWQRRLGMVLISGYCHCAGQRERRAVSSMAPPNRGLCRRTFRRAMILADGRLTTCDQDFRGVQSLGNLADSTLSDLWTAGRLKAIREGRHDHQPLCPACDEWHRP